MRFLFLDGLEEETGFVWEGRYTYIYTDPDRKGQTKLYPTLPPSPVGEGKTI